MPHVVCKNRNPLHTRDVATASNESESEKHKSLAGLCYLDPSTNAKGATMRTKESSLGRGPFLRTLWALRDICWQDFEKDWGGGYPPTPHSSQGLT